jgi:hypothetical protein
LWSNALINVSHVGFLFVQLKIQVPYGPKYPISALLEYLQPPWTSTALYKFQEKWMTYRIAQKSLKREKILYQTEPNPISYGSSFNNTFVNTMEGIMNNENAVWTQIINRKQILLL